MWCDFLFVFTARLGFSVRRVLLGRPRAQKEHTATSPSCRRQHVQVFGTSLLLLIRVSWFAADVGLPPSPPFPSCVPSSFSPPGYFCLAATATGGTECGGNHVYCPPASSSPTLVVPGQYSVGGAPTTRSSSVDCPPGSWCSSGVATLCPSGRYGNVGLLSDPLCSGGCPVGHYCGIGTADPEPCWAPTSYCPALSVSPTDVDVGFYTMPEDEPR